jgi:hypothetical protein
MENTILPGLPFQIAAGSVLGREHRRLGRNNQDAFHVLSHDQSLITVVCDGCSGGAHSEVGANLGAKIVAQVIHEQLRLAKFSEYGSLGDPTSGFWHQVHRTILTQLRKIMEVMGGDRHYVMQNYLLFTIVGTVITSETTTLFIIGDGVLGINGEISQMKPVTQNMPPYIAYGLDESFSPDWSQLKVVQHQPTDSVDSVLVGSDGVKDLMAIADKPIPGGKQVIGPISQFWEDERYFHNPDQLRRKLFLLNREGVNVDWEQQKVGRSQGLLPDDTTLIVIRRQQSSQS